MVYLCVKSKNIEFAKKSRKVLPQPDGGEMKVARNERFQLDGRNKFSRSNARHGDKVNNNLYLRIA